MVTACFAVAGKVMLKRRSHNLLVPRGQPDRPGCAGKLTQNENVVTPTDKVAAAERMSTTITGGQHAAQPGYPLAAGGIKPAAASGDNRAERSLGNIWRREGELGIEKTKPGGMQNHCLSEQPIAFALALSPLVPEFADAAEQRHQIRSARHRTGDAQSRSLECSVVVAGIGDEGLPLGIQ